MKPYSTYPRVPHLPGSNADESDLIHDDATARAFLREPVVVREKIDGLNVMLSSAGRGRVSASLKPEWHDVMGGRVERAIAIWLMQREHNVASVLSRGGCFYGEWLWHTVSMRYDTLPAVFVSYAALDRRGRFVDEDTLEDMCVRANIVRSGPIFTGVIGSMSALLRLAARRSRFRRGGMEGLIFERPSLVGEARYAKWVAADYQHPKKGVLRGGMNVVSAR